MGFFKQLSAASNRPPCAACGSLIRTLDLIYGLDRHSVQGPGDVRILPGIISHLDEVKKTLLNRFVARFGTGLCERCAIETATEILAELNIVCHYCGELHDVARLTNQNPAHSRGLGSEGFWQTRPGFYDLMICNRPRSASYMSWFEYQKRRNEERSVAPKPRPQSHNSSEHPFQQYADDNGMSLSDFMDSLGD